MLPINARVSRDFLLNRYSYHERDRKYETVMDFEINTGSDKEHINLEKYFISITYGYVKSVVFT